MRPFREVESTRPEIVETEYRGLVPFCLLATFSLATRQIVEYNYVCQSSCQDGAKLLIEIMQRSQ